VDEDNLNRTMRATSTRVAREGGGRGGLGRPPGDVSVEANPVAQTATVTFDPALASVAELRHVVERCGFECAMLATVVLLGHWFEMRARGGASAAIRGLMDLAPPKAVVLREGEPVEVPRGAVAGDLLLIRPGAKVPVDAEVIEGESEVDESTVTGESLPIPKGVGDKVVGATINKNGTLRARTTAVGSDTALAQIVKLVQEAQNSKAPA
jgi:cation transport ATPase